MNTTASYSETGGDSFPDRILAEPTQISPWLVSFNKAAGGQVLLALGGLGLLALGFTLFLFTTGDGPVKWDLIIRQVREQSYQYLLTHAGGLLAGLGGATLVVGLLAASYFYARNEWLTDCDADQLSLDEAERAMSEELQSYVKQLPANVEPPLKKALGTTWKVLRQACAYHRRTLLQQTAYQYALARTLLYSSLGAGLMGLLLVDEGWQKAPLAVQLLFLTFAVAIAYCSTMPKLLCYEKNIAAQLLRYRLYRQLQVECFHYAATARQLDLTDPVESLSAFLGRIHRQLKDNPFTAYDFEAIDPSQATSIGTTLTSSRTAL